MSYILDNPRNQVNIHVNNWQRELGDRLRKRMIVVTESLEY